MKPKKPATELAKLLSKHRKGKLLADIHVRLSDKGVDVDYSLVSLWFSGKRCPRLSNFAALCDVMELSNHQKCQALKAVLRDAA